MALPLVAAALLAGSSTAASAPSLRFNLSLTPLDAAFDSNPTGNFGGTWNYTIDTDGAEPYVGVPVSWASAVWSEGESPSAPPASVAFQGDAYYVYGKSPANSADGDAQLAVDGKAVGRGSLQGGLLGSATGLEWGNHSAVFAPAKGGPWEVDSLVVTTGMETQAPTLNDATLSVVELLSEKRLNGWFNWTGNWTILDALPGVNDTAANGYPHAFGTNGSAVTFIIPANTSFLFVNGTVGPDHNVMGIEVNPLDGGSAMVRRVNASRTFRAKGRVAFMQLDPTKQYTAKIQTFSQETNGVWLPWDESAGGLSSVSFYSGLSNVKRPNSGSSSRMSTGQIVGAAVGSGVGLLLLVGLLIGLYYLRKRRSRKTARPMSFDVSHHHSVHHPFQQTSARGNGTPIDSGQNSWLADQYAPFPQPPEHAPPVLPRLSADQPRSPTEMQPFLTPSGESVQRLMTPDKSGSSLNHYHAAPAATYPLGQDLNPDYLREGHESLAGTQGTRGSRLSVTNPDPISAQTTHAPHAEPQSLMGGYTDQQLASPADANPAGRPWINTPGEPTIRE